MADAATIDIARATSADVPRISRALARSFQDDPVLAWVVGDEASRSARLPAVFAAFAEAFLPHQESYVAGDGAGAALWAPAGVEPLTEEQAEALDQRLSAALEGHVGRARAIAELQAEHHPAQPCFYLQFVGVAPEHQGRGLGSRLLATVLRRCDEARVPAYLEATSPRNRRLYERHGFETRSELVLPQGPPMWPMWRDPAPA